MSRRKRFRVWLATLAGPAALLVWWAVAQPFTAPAFERLPLPARDNRPLVDAAITSLKLSQIDDYGTLRLGDTERPGRLVGARTQIVRHVPVPRGGAVYEVHLGGIDHAVPVTVKVANAPPTSTVVTANDWTRITVPLHDSAGTSQTIRISLLGRPEALAAWAQDSVRPAIVTAERRDVYIIALDTVRRDQLTPYAPSLTTTPALGQLSRASIRFDQAISTSSWTVASHATLFTGRYPSDSLGYSSRVEPGELTLADRFAAAGYRTFGVSGGPYTDPRWGLHQGFDEYVVSGDRENARQATTRATKWLEGAGDGPVFMFLNYFNAHEPLELSREVQQASGVESGVSTAEWHALDAGRLPLTEGARKRLLRAYRAELTEVDRQVGNLIRTLKALGRWERSLVVVWSDHGQLLGERDTVGHAFTLDEELIHVPLLIKPPDGAAVRPGVYPWLFQNDDLFVLCQALAGLHTPDGAAMVSDLRTQRPVRKYAFAKIHHAPLPELVAARRWRSETLWAVRSDTLKIVRDREGRLYSYELDGPEERLVSKTPASTLLAALDRFVQMSQRPDSLRTVGALSPEERERLRALGYMH